MKNILLIGIASILLNTIAAYPQAGIPDSDFDADGKIITEFGSENSVARAVAIQEDQKIIVVGSSSESDIWDFTLVRYNIDGTLDNSFSVDGKVRTSIDINGSQCEDIVLQPDGKIIVVGSSHNSGDYEFVTARYNSDGTLDNSFGDNGKVTIAIDDQYNFPQACAIQADGKILVAGYATNSGTSNDFVILRYSPNGTPDSAFNEDGVVVTNLFGLGDLCRDIAIQEDGRIIAVGASDIGGKVNFALARYTSDGGLDPSFGEGGKINIEIGEYDDHAFAVTIQPDHKILVAGASGYNSSDRYFALARFNPDGIIDSSFSTDGKVTTAVGTHDDICYSMALQPDGKILLAGYSQEISNYTDFALVRYNPDGTHDYTFGDNAKVLTSFTNEYNKAIDIAVQQNGRIVVAGETSAEQSNIYDIAVARYLSGLKLDVLDFTVPDHSVLIYPNPLKGTAILEYTLNKAEEISVDLFDVQGKLVQNFISSENRSEGKHSETLNINESVPSGNYILTISNDIEKQSIQVIIK